jgi:hypothetical protein
MRLRTTAGRYAGEIRDYAFGAGRAALQVGTAAQVEDVAQTSSRPAPTLPAKLKASTRRKG